MTVSVQMPQYQSHKKVWALKIQNIVFDSDLAKQENRETDGSAKLYPERTDYYAPFNVEHKYVRKHLVNNEQITNGDLGYYVVYEGGYKSWSPTKAFESGYTEIQ